MASIDHEAASQRRYYRMTFPLNITLEGATYKTADWSVGGFRLEKYPNALQKDQEISIEVHVPYQGYKIAFSQQARVVKSDGPGTDLACEFIDLEDRSREVLTFISKGLISGEMAGIDEVIKRIDTPVTPTPLVEDASWQDQPLSRKLRRITVGLMYLVIGAVLTLYVVVALYSYFYRLQVETAVVEAYAEAVLSPQDGIMEGLNTEVGNDIKKGEVLFTLRDPALEREIAQAEVVILEAQAQLEESQAVLADQEQQLALYTEISAARIQAADKSAKAIGDQLNLAQSELNRKRQLFERGIRDRVDVDEAASKLAGIRVELVHAQSDAEIASQSVKAIDQGLYFTGEYLRDGLPLLRAEVEKARKLLQAAQERKRIAESQLENLKVNAPFDGKVLELASSEGSYIPAGKAVCLMEKTETRRLVAYLTQSEISQVKHGEDVLCYIPSLDERHKASIVSIDRTMGFKDEVNHQFRWRKPEDPTGEILLEFHDAAVMAKLPTGIPVIVNFDRTSQNEVIANVLNALTGLVAQDNNEASTSN